MKNLSLIVNVILGVAVAVLYFLHFNGPAINEDLQDESVERGEYLPSSANIVYVNFDTLLNNYDMFFELQKKFLEKQQSLESDLTRSSRSYENQVVDFQDKVQKGLVTRSQAQQLELELTQLQQELMQQREQYSQELMEEEQVMNRQLQHSIYDYLEEYNKDHDYHYILSHSFGGPFLYTDENLNITRDVIEGLNKKYQEDNLE
ncbi:MAG: OmpH family outer membrane protein [Bacteroidales bacterium]